MTSKLIIVFVISLTLCSKAASQISDDKNNSNQIQNVLFIISDDLKASALGCYGNDICQTPNIDRLAERSVVFNRAYCQGTWCLPSRLSFMFGRYRGFARGRPNVDGHPSFAEHFKNNGWHTARAGKIYHMRVPGDIIDGTNGPDHAPSWSERINCPGLEAHTPGAYALLNKDVFTNELQDRQSTGDPHRMFVSVKADGDGTKQPDYRAATVAIELLNKIKDRRFLLAVGFVRPHYPMIAPKAFFDPYPYDKIKLPKSVPNDLADIPAMGRAGTLSDKCGIGEFPDNQKRMWSAYYASVTFMDQQVGRVLDELDRLGLAEKTAIVFASDHGYHLGEHEFWQKNNLHEEVTRVPLMIAAPGIEPAHSDALTELVDIYPTLAELAGLPIPRGVQGKSLVDVLKNPGTNVREAAFSFRGNRSHALRTENWAYMSYVSRDGSERSEELYDMVNDAHQFTNLATQQEHRAKLDAFRIKLARKLEIVDGK